MHKLLLSLSMGAMLIATPSLAQPREERGPPGAPGPAKPNGAGPGKDRPDDKRGGQAPRIDRQGPAEVRNMARDATAPLDWKNERPVRMDGPGNIAGRVEKRMEAEAARRRDDRRDESHWSDRRQWARPGDRTFGSEPFEIVQAGRFFGFDQSDRRGLIDGCPPGLARKRDGCTPPRLANNDRNDDFWNNMWGRRDDSRYYYRDGYLMRYRENSILDYVPLLSGALSVGSVFPSEYRSYPVSDYYAGYYGENNDDYVYRYADGVIYALDPESYAISEVAGLLTGDDFTIGEPLPRGYEVYNVPYRYRDRYVDSSDQIYRYSDGYVYRVDPQTQLIQAAIQLLS